MRLDLDQFTVLPKSDTTHVRAVHDAIHHHQWRANTGWGLKDRAFGHLGACLVRAVVFLATPDQPIGLCRISRRGPAPPMAFSNAVYARKLFDLGRCGI
jgi:hypothetical protein